MVLCDNVPNVPNGNKNPTEENGNKNPTEDSVTCRTEVTYTCNEGFTLEGDSVLECGAGGQLKGQLPVCKTFGNFHLCNFMDTEHGLVEHVISRYSS